MKGQLVREISNSRQAAGEQKIEVPMEDFASGIYNVSVKIGSAVFSTKLVKE